MGKSIVKKNCLRCNREFSTKPKKVVTLVNGKRKKHYEVKDYCQSCRHIVTKAKQHGIKERIQVRIREKKVNIKKEVEMLRRLENYNPALLDKLRSKKYESKES